ncbi:uncharacterized protein [Battus philenor]|uniref:uncharacterized protein n=1 Tax=Battus philenor TaxID=42288 RepID=UPI0035CF65B8
MEHIRQFDWCYSEPERYFVKEEDLDNCATEKILRNKFRDPMICSDSEDEKPTFNWDEIFAKEKGGEFQNRVYVPGIRGLPPYLKLSALTSQQHYQCLKVICAQNPKILETEFIPRPTKQDYKVHEEVQAVYIKEQKEYIEWAKNLWTTTHCIRALRPKPPVETTYEAEFNVKAKELESFPKNYVMVAQIPLETRNVKFEIVHDKDLITVDQSLLPQINNPNPIKQRLSIMVPRSVPEPCPKHPCRFVLPNESSTTMLPLTEVHRELAEYAIENGAQIIASEKALKCLVELDRSWNLCLTVCQVFTLDGETRSVLVMGREFSILRECPQMRTYRAFKHLLAYALIPDSEKHKLLYKGKNKTGSGDSTSCQYQTEELEDSSDDDCSLFIVAEKAKTDNSDTEQLQSEEVADGKRSSKSTKGTCQKENLNKNGKQNENNEYYKCTCRETMFEQPPPRSFTKWRVNSEDSRSTRNLIVHCSHKLKDSSGEVIIEPIPEYQLDLGASAVSKERTRSLALSLYLRKNTSLLNVRIDSQSGDVVRCDELQLEDQETEEELPAISNAVGTALDQLHGLLPGHYILRHEPSHGTNALLYGTQTSGGGESLQLQFSCAQRTDIDEAQSLKIAPTLTPLLLPMHKFRKILPCAFTTHEGQVAKEPRKPAARQRTPPQALTLAEEENDANVKVSTAVHCVVGVISAKYSHRFLAPSCLP